MKNRNDAISGHEKQAGRALFRNVVIDKDSRYWNAVGHDCIDYYTFDWDDVDYYLGKDAYDYWVQFYTYDSEDVETLDDSELIELLTDFGLPSDYRPSNLEKCYIYLNKDAILDYPKYRLRFIIRDGIESKEVDFLINNKWLSFHDMNYTDYMNAVDKYLPRDLKVKFTMQTDPDTWYDYIDRMQTMYDDYKLIRKHSNRAVDLNIERVQRTY